MARSVVPPSYPGVISAGAVISRERAVSRRLGVRTWPVAVGVLVFGSVVARVLLAQRHTGPHYWPDEYIYASISRSLVHGHLQVRGQPAAFYAILQPILAAPIWRFFPTYEAYRVLQAENAIAASLVVIPLWFLGRELKLPRLTIYLAAVYALLVPTLAMVPVTISDFIAYPIAIGAAAIAVRSLDEPTRARQITFLCLAGLATLTRIQYVVLVPAYLAAALVLERRRAHRRHPWVFLAVLPALGGAVLALTGYYAVSVSTFRFGMITWTLLQGFLLSLTAGVAIVPGAVAAILRPRGRVETAFSCFTGVFILLVFVEASGPAAAEGRYKERYLLAIVPLLALAFGMYMQGRRPHRLIVLAVGAGLMITAARVPLSGYTIDAPKYDSQTLDVVWLLQRHVGAAQSSLLVALFITVSAAVAMAGSWRPPVIAIALPLSIAWMLVATGVAVHIDGVMNKPVHDPTWIDRAAGGANVTVVATPASSRLALIPKLYWNTSIDREVVLEAAQATDSYPTTQIHPGPNGQLTGVHGDFLFDTSGTQAVIAGATKLAADGDYTLFRGANPRFSLLAENLLSTGWLSPVNRIRAWPDRGDANRSPVVQFTLSLPPEGSRTVHMQLDEQVFTVTPRRALQVTCRAPSWPFKLLLASNDLAADSTGRPVTAGLTHLKVTSAPKSPATGCSTSTG